MRDSYIIGLMVFFYIICSLESIGYDHLRFKDTLCSLYCILRWLITDIVQLI